MHDRRLAAREVTERPVAHPRGVEEDVCRLGAAELAARAAHVVLIIPGGRGGGMAVANAPAELLELRPLVLVAVENHGDLERRGAVAREVQERKKRLSLPVRARFPSELEPRVAPVGHGGIARRRTRRGHGPLGEKHWRACVVPADATIGKRRARCTDVLSDRDVEIVGREREMSLADPRLG